MSWGQMQPRNRAPYRAPVGMDTSPFPGPTLAIGIVGLSLTAVAWFFVLLTPLLLVTEIAWLPALVLSILAIVLAAQHRRLPGSRTPLLLGIIGASLCVLLVVPYCFSLLHAIAVTSR